MLGGGGERRYLLSFQAPGEARGTGGLAGLVGVLETNPGRLELGDVLPYQDLGPSRIRNVEAPDWFEASYGPQQALTEWPQANVSPNHPVVADVLLDMYEAARGERLDGVLTMDPITLAYLMEGIGSIETRRPEMVLDSSNAADVLLHDSYTDFETPEEQNFFLGEVVDGFWSRLSGC